MFPLPEIPNLPGAIFFDLPSASFGSKSFNSKLCESSFFAVSLIYLAVFLSPLPHAEPEREIRGAAEHGPLGGEEAEPQQRPPHEVERGHEPHVPAAQERGQGAHHQPEVVVLRQPREPPDPRAPFPFGGEASRLERLVGVVWCSEEGSARGGGGSVHQHRLRSRDVCV